MKYLVISDVHSNFIALESVLEDSEGEYDEIINLGDILGLMGFPGKTVKFMMENPKYNLKGNHDFAIANMNEGHVNSEKLSQFELKYTMDILSDEQLSFVYSLDSIEFTDNGSTVMCHAMPHPIHSTGYESGNKGLLPKDYTEEAPLLEDNFGSGLTVLHGHTHKQAHLDASKFGHDVEFINPGSVGQPMGKAEYAIMDTYNNNVELRSVKYDTSPVKSRLKELSVPLKFWRK